MSDLVHLLPRPGLTVLMPDTFIPLPPEGRTVRLDSYWRRRLRDGDVTVRQTPPAPAPAARAKPAAKE
ncbi:MAG: DUF2635 domain-containing protein [Pseudomonadota bacterium]